jgi:hypothetical protein
MRRCRQLRLELLHQHRLLRLRLQRLARLRSLQEAQCLLLHLLLAHRAHELVGEAAQRHSGQQRVRLALFAAGCVWAHHALGDQRLTRTGVARRLAAARQRDSLTQQLLAHEALQVLRDRGLHCGGRRRADARLDGLLRKNVRRRDENGVINGLAQIPRGRLRRLRRCSCRRRTGVLRKQRAVRLKVVADCVAVVAAVARGRLYVRPRVVKAARAADAAHANYWIAVDRVAGQGPARGHRDSADRGSGPTRRVGAERCHLRLLQLQLLLLLQQDELLLLRLEPHLLQAFVVLAKQGRAESSTGPVEMGRKGAK